MTVYAIIDEDIQIARHRGKGKLAVFTDLEMLKKHAWRYQDGVKKYQIAELEIEQIYDLKEEEK